VMSDHWGFVIAAYGLAAVAFAVYWRWLVRKDRELTALAAGRARRVGAPRPQPGSRPSTP
jgi:drug/metabolite transporter superfamily protein YnfA